MWTVIEEPCLINNKYFAKCQCSCGTVRYVLIYSLLNNISKSCGCAQGELGKLHRVPDSDILGKKFGKLTAIQKVNNRYFLCRCDCGTEIMVSRYYLVSGCTVDCGCSRAERVISEAFSQKWGHWRVMKYVGRISGDYVFECMCDCGTIKNVQWKNLKRGSSKSCGCRGNIV